LNNSILSSVSPFNGSVYGKVATDSTERRFK
jgi:hypothetical protein